MDKSTSSVIEKIEHKDESPLDYDELVRAWNSLCEQTWADGGDDFQFADIENAALATLSNSPDNTRTGLIGNEISRMLSSFDYPTFLVNKEGRIAATNSAASIEFRLKLGDNIDLIPLLIDESKPLSELVKDSLQSSSTDDSNEATLKRAYGINSERRATIAISTSLGETPSALVFVITTHWKPHSADLLKNQFNLTDAEAAVLINFVDGYSSQDIAALRNRSHATIRTQLQSILTKTGARTQTELLRIALSVSDFVTNLGQITDAIDHPYRRRAEILQEGGRLVEVTLMGDLSGSPLVTIGQASLYTFNADFEQRLYKAGLYIICFCAPGYGRTDPVPKGENRLDVISNDLTSILDQLNIKSCPIIARISNAPICYALTNRLPNRISHLVQVCACGPLRYAKTTETVSPWITGIIRSCNSHPAMKRMLLSGAVKAWAILGARQVMRSQMCSNPIDAEYLLREENLIESEHALKTATDSGITAAADDMEMAFGDWTSDIEKTRVKITIVHGKQDQLFTIESVRSLAAAFAEKTELIEIDNAGFTVFQSHPDKVIELLSSIVKRFDNKNNKIPPLEPAD